MGGRPALYVARGGRRLRTLTGDEGLPDRAAGGLPEVARGRRGRRLTLAEVDGEPARGSALAPLLEGAGFVRDYRGLTLEVR